MLWAAWGQGAPGQRVSPGSPPSTLEQPRAGEAPARLCSPLGSGQDGAGGAAPGWHPPRLLLAPLGAAGGWAMGMLTVPGPAPELAATPAGGPPASWFPKDCVPQLLACQPAGTSPRAPLSLRRFGSFAIRFAWTLEVFTQTVVSLCSCPVPITAALLRASRGDEGLHVLLQSFDSGVGAVIKTQRLP